MKAGMGTDKGISVFFPWSIFAYVKEFSDVITYIFVNVFVEFSKIFASDYSGNLWYHLAVAREWILYNSGNQLWEWLNHIFFTGYW